ncbi:MAG: hypothetical protein H6Q69_2866 [Firmicutes bacterium]|nr:hypothetical protein [Bacillota bacterium]
MLFTIEASGIVLILHAGSIPSKKSTIGGRYSIAGLEMIFSAYRFLKEPANINIFFGGDFNIATD